MKAGIITFHWSDNYGAVLQAHALQSFLQGRGHKVEIIDYRPEGRKPAFKTNWLAKNPLRMVRKWRQNLEEIVAAWQDRPRHTLFEQFRVKYLCCTQALFNSADQLKELAARYDVVLTGSDQVWNPEFLWYLNSFDAYLPEFAGQNTRRISYAASFGCSDVSSICPEWREEMKKRLLRMGTISVREPSGIEVVRELCGRTDAVQVADPTLLLDRDHYERIAGDKGSERGGLFSYLLHGLEKTAEPLVREVASSKGWKITHCNPQQKGFSGAGGILGPIEWLRAIRDADFVLTNSFHGTVFCLIFHTPFAVVPVSGRKSAMNNRLTELLTSVGLEERITDNLSIANKMAGSPIDWIHVDQRVFAMRDRAIEFLKQNNL